MPWKLILGAGVGIAGAVGGWLWYQQTTTEESGDLRFDQLLKKCGIRFDPRCRISNWRVERDPTHPIYQAVAQMITQRVTRTAPTLVVEIDGRVGSMLLLEIVRDFRARRSDYAFTIRVIGLSRPDQPMASEQALFLRRYAEMLGFEFKLKYVSSYTDTRVTASTVWKATQEERFKYTATAHETVLSGVSQDETADHLWETFVSDLPLFDKVVFRGSIVGFTTSTGGFDLLCPLSDYPEAALFELAVETGVPFFAPYPRTVPVAATRSLVELNTELTQIESVLKYELLGRLENRFYFGRFGVYLNLHDIEIGSEAVLRVILGWAFKECPELREVDCSRISRHLDDYRYTSADGKVSVFIWDRQILLLTPKIEPQEALYDRITHGDTRKMSVASSVRVAPAIVELSAEYRWKQLLTHGRIEYPQSIAGEYYRADDEVALADELNLPPKLVEWLPFVVSRDQTDSGTASVELTLAGAQSH